MLRAMKCTALALGILLAVTFEPTASAAKLRRHHQDKHHKLLQSKSPRKSLGKHKRLEPLKKAKSEKLPDRNTASGN